MGSLELRGVLVALIGIQLPLHWVCWGPLNMVNCIMLALTAYYLGHADGNAWCLRVFEKEIGKCEK